MLIDVILLLILVSLAMSGYRRGLLLSLLGVLVVVLSSMGATAARQAFTPAVAEYVEPKLAEVIQPVIEEHFAARTQQAIDDTEDLGLTIGGQKITLGDLADLLKQFGLDVEQNISDGAAGALEPAAEAAAQDVAHSISERVAGLLVYVAAWLILYLILHNVAMTLNIVDRMPVIHTFNRVGGALLSVLGGLIVMVVVAAVCDGAQMLPGEMGPLSQALRQIASGLTRQENAEILQKYYENFIKTSYNSGGSCNI